MRPCLPMLMLLVIGGCAPASLEPGNIPGPATARMPLEIWRNPGEAPRMRPAILNFGDARPGARFLLSVNFDSDQDKLGPVKSVTWQMSLNGYCSNKGTVVRSILIGPSGQIWRVNPVFVPAGPDRTQNWSSGGFGEGYGGPDTAALFTAVSAGGDFTLAIEDDEGGQWLSTPIRIPSARDQALMFAANQKAFRATDPDTVPVAAEPPLIMVRSAPVSAPQPPRTCP